jgi:hypothetical protein
MGLTQKPKLTFKVRVTGGSASASREAMGEALT